MSSRMRSNPDAERSVASWRRWKWLGLAVFAVTFSGAVGLAQFLPDIYRSTATILIERPLVPESFVRSAVSSDLETRLETIREQVQSRARLWEVITTYNLDPELQATASREVAVAQMRKDLEVEVKNAEHRQQSESTTAMTISYQGPDPKTVAAVTNHLATAFVKENSRTRERAAKGTSAFLRSQLEKVGKQLESQEQRVGGYKRLHGGELPNSREAVISGLERLSSQLSRNLDMQSRARERLADAERELAMPVLPPPRPDGTESDEARLARLRAELAQLRQRYTEQYPDIATVQAEISTLERRMKLRSADGTPGPTPSVSRAAAQKQMLEAELKSLREEEGQLRPAITQYLARLERMPQRDLELEEMTRDYASVREQYDSLLTRYRDAALAEGVELRSHGEEFSVLDPAVPAMAPFAPNRQRLLIMGLIFALGLTVAVMFAADRLDSSFHTVTEVRAFTNVPVLATVPPIITRRDQARGVLRAGLAVATLVVAVAAVLGGAYFLADGNHSLVRVVSRGGS